MNQVQDSPAPILTKTAEYLLRIKSAGRKGRNIAAIYPATQLPGHRELFSICSAGKMAKKE